MMNKTHRAKKNQEEDLNIPLSHHATGRRRNTNRLLLARTNVYHIFLHLVYFKPYLPISIIGGDQCKRMAKKCNISY